MRSAHPTPDEIIAHIGCVDAKDVDACLLAAADAEFHKEEEDGPQDLERAFNCLRAILMRHWDNPAPAVQHYVASALMRRAQILAHAGQIDMARNDYDEVWRRYKDSEDPAVRQPVAAALLEAGQLEENEGNLTEAERWYELTERYAADADPITLQQVVDAQCNHVDIYIGRGWLDPAFEKLSTIRARWQDHPEYWIRRRIAHLLVQYAAGVKEDDERCEEALPLFDEAMAYAARAVIPPAYFIQAGAWLSKSHCFEKLERYEEAALCVDAFETWMETVVWTDEDYGKKTDSDMEGTLNTAYLIKARCLSELGRHAEALEAFKRSGVTLVDLDDDFDKRQRTCIKLLGLVKILADLGEKQEAEACFSAIVDRMFSFGKEAIAPEAFASMAMMHSYVTDGRGLFDKHVTTPSAGSPDPS